MTGKSKLGLAWFTPKSRSKKSNSNQFQSWQGLLGLFLLLLLGYFGCEPPPSDQARSYPGDSVQSSADNTTTAGQWATSNQIGWNGSDQSGYTETSVPGRREAILVGSFNIQTFGRAKMSRPDVVEILVDIARRFDILAIQELRDISEETIPEFLALINADGSRFRAVVSPRISYQESRYAEQLVYLYDADQIEVISQPYVAFDPYDDMYRPPFVTHFRCLSYPREDAFSFVLMNIHVAPLRTATEFKAMETIVSLIRDEHPGEDDFILIGDMNEEPGRFNQYRWFQNQFAAIPSQWKTNTRLTKNYDNIIFDFRQTAEFTGQSGVLNIMDEYGLSLEQALLVSDHLPVWAVFSTREQNRNAMGSRAELNLPQTR